jgi:phosphoribosylpyrophosphate synthetase
MNCLVLSSAAHLKGLQVRPPHDSGVYESSEIRIGVPGRLAKESVSVIPSLLFHANSFLEILFTADTLKHIEAQINIVIPRLAYARPKKPKASEDSGVQAVCRALQKCGFANAYVLDVHSTMLGPTFRFENVLPYDLYHEGLAGDR